MKKFLRNYKRSINDLGNSNLKFWYESHENDINNCNSKKSLRSKLYFFKCAHYYQNELASYAIKEAYQDLEPRSLWHFYQLTKLMVDKSHESRSDTHQVIGLSPICLDRFEYDIYLRMFFEEFQEQDIKRIEILQSLYTEPDDEDDYVEYQMYYDRNTFLKTFATLIVQAYMDESKLQLLLEYLETDKNGVFDKVFELFASDGYVFGSKEFLPFPILGLLGLFRKYNITVNTKNIITKQYLDYEKFNQVKSKNVIQDQFVNDYKAFLEGVEFIEENGVCVDVKFNKVFGE